MQNAEVVLTMPPARPPHAIQCGDTGSVQLLLPGNRCEHENWKVQVLPLLQSAQNGWSQGEMFDCQGTGQVRHGCEAETRHRHEKGLRSDVRDKGRYESHDLFQRVDQEEGYPPRG